MHKCSALQHATLKQHAALFSRGSCFRHLPFQNLHQIRSNQAISKVYPTPKHSQTHPRGHLRILVYDTTNEPQLMRKKKSNLGCAKVAACATCDSQSALLWLDA